MIMLEREENFKETSYCPKGGIKMGFYEDIKKGLLEAIEIEKGTLPLIQKDNMPAPTFAVNTSSKED